MLDSKTFLQPIYLTQTLLAAAFHVENYYVVEANEFVFHFHFLFIKEMFFYERVMIVSKKQ